MLAFTLDGFCKMMVVKDDDGDRGHGDGVMMEHTLTM